jgi:hypothetical protein
VPSFGIGRISPLALVKRFLSRRKTGFAARLDEFQRLANVLSNDGANASRKKLMTINPRTAAVTLASRYDHQTRKRQMTNDRVDIAENLFAR